MTKEALEHYLGCEIEDDFSVDLTGEGIDIRYKPKKSIEFLTLDFTYKGFSPVVEVKGGAKLKLNGK